MTLISYQHLSSHNDIGWWYSGWLDLCLETSLGWNRLVANNRIAQYSPLLFASIRSSCLLSRIYPTSVSIYPTNCSGILIFSSTFSPYKINKARQPMQTLPR